jgi:hypothetical protein
MEKYSYIYRLGEIIGPPPPNEIEAILQPNWEEKHKRFEGKDTFDIGHSNHKAIILQAIQLSNEERRDFQDVLRQSLKKKKEKH